MRNDSPPKGIPIRTKGLKGARTSTPLNVPVGVLSPSVNVGKPSMPINSSEIVNLSTIDTSSQSGLPKVEVTDLRSSTHFEFNKNQKAVETLYTRLTHGRGSELDLNQIKKSRFL